MAKLKNLMREKNQEDYDDSIDVGNNGNEDIYNDDDYV